MAKLMALVGLPAVKTQALRIYERSTRDWLLYPLRVTLFFYGWLPAEWTAPHNPSPYSIITFFLL